MLHKSLVSIMAVGLIVALLAFAGLALTVVTLAAVGAVLSTVIAMEALSK